MEDLIKDINEQVEKCVISSERLNINDLQKAHLFGMIDAYQRTIYNIELNYSNKTFEEIHEENVKKWREK
jgi:hypothetical protein